MGTRPGRSGRLLALGIAGLLLVGSACTDEPEERPSSATGSAASSTPSATSSVVTTSIPEPDTLLPLDATEPEDLAVVRALYTGLVTHDPDTAEVVPAVAESITSDDGGTTWTVVLEDGWTFHDGSSVTARSFVDAWNHGALETNGRANRDAFADIAGFAALQCGRAAATDADEDAPSDCDGAPPARTTLSGLQVLSDTEFRVTLSAPVALWPRALGYPAFAPLPQVFFDDPAAFADHPVGNGPFRLGDAGRTDATIPTVAYEDYAGDRRAQVAGVDFRVQPDRDDALAALYAGEVDVLTDVPPERWPETRSRVAHAEAVASSTLDYLGFPVDRGAYADPDVRAALSMAIDRDLITETLFDGLRVPATSVLAPSAPGHEADVCPAWQFDPAGARERLEQSGGIEEPIVVWFNEGGGHRPWLESVVRQWGEHLGVDADQVQFEERPFDEYLDLVAAGDLTGPYRLGWEVSHAHPQTALQPLRDARSPRPDGPGTAPDALDEALDRAAAATPADEAAAVRRDAIALACEDATIVPMFHGTHTVAWVDGLAGVHLDPLGILDYAGLRRP